MSFIKLSNNPVLPAALPHEILQMDYYVPDSVNRQDVDRFKGKTIFQEVFTVAPETTQIYFKRAIGDWGLPKNTNSMMI